MGWFLSNSHLRDATLAGRLGLAVLLLASTATSAAEWTRFRGPNGSGIAEARDLPIEAGRGTNLLWRVPAPTGSSSPIVTGSKIILTGYEGRRLLVWCVDLKTGKRLWEGGVEAVRQERKSSPNDAASSTPVTDGTNIYAFFSGFGLLALSLEGEERWRKPLGPFNPPHGMASSPLIAAGNVILVADQVTDSHIAAFDARSGDQKWRTPRGNFVGGYSTPVLAGGEVVVAGPVEMIAYSPSSGERRWSLPRMGVMPIGSPVWDGSRVFVYNDAVPPFESLARELKGDRNGDGKLEPDEFPDPSFKEAVLAIDRAYGNGDGAIDQKEWDGALRLMNTMNALVAARIDRSQPTELWRTSKMLAGAASPLIYEGVLYLVRNGGILSSVDPATGEVLRQDRIPGFERPIFASPVAGDGKLYLLNESGKLAVVKAGREWTVLAVNDLAENCYASPALAGTTLLVRSKDALWAFGRAKSR